MTSSSSSGQLDFNHWLLRLIAYVIDAIITAIIGWIISTLIFIGIAFGDVYAFFAFGAVFFYSWFVVGIIQVIYFTILETYWGASLGKRILGLQVQMTNGSRVTIDKALIRNLSKIVWPLLILDWLIGVATAGADRRQKYSDRFAGTTVVAVRQVLTTPPLNPQNPPPT